MIGFTSLLTSVFMFTLLIVPGYILGKLQLVERPALKSMTNIMMYVAMPFLAFSKLISIDLTALAPVNIVLPLFGPFFIIGIALLISVLFFPKKDDSTYYRINRFCSVFGNCGFLGIPLAEVLFPHIPEIAVYVSLFNVSNTFLVLTLGVFVLTGDKKDISLKRALISPIMAAIVLGVTFSLTNVTATVPQLKNYADILASLTTPLSMLIIGVELSYLKISAFWKTASLLTVSLNKLILTPLILTGILLICKLCGITLSTSLQASLFISAGISTAASASAMSSKYGLDGEFAAVHTLGTTILCTVTFPVLYLLASTVLGW